MSAIFETEFFDLKDAEENVTKASTAKLVLLAMADHANDEGEGIYPSVERLCRKTSLSEQTIRNTLDALKYNGIVFLAGKSKYGTNNHTINTNAFPRAIGKEVTVLTLYPLDPLTGNVTPPNRSLEATLPVIPESSININKPSTEIKGIEASIMQGRPTTQEDIDPAKVQHDTLAAFEVAFKLDPGNIAWFNQKPEWGRLRRKLVDKYQLDPDYFKKYHKWYTEEGKFAGGMNVQQMRRDPDGFILAMNIFEAASVEIPQNPEREEGKGFYA